MDYNRTILVLKTEMECVRREGCDRECCSRCDLVMDKIDVLIALRNAIDCVRECKVRERKMRCSNP